MKKILGILKEVDKEFFKGRAKLFKRESLGLHRLLTIFSIQRFFVCIVSMAGGRGFVDQSSRTV